jgi:fumarylacetoacetase
MDSFLPIPPDSPFPPQNLPFGVFRPLSGGDWRVGVAIGQHALDLAALAEAGLIEGGAALFARPSLNAFLALGRPAWQTTRAAIQAQLRPGSALSQSAEMQERALWRLDEIALGLPAEIGDYTDFYSSLEHATNVGVMFRGPEYALPPNWRHLPIAYHGRASSVVASGAPVRRPWGQQIEPGASQPVFGPTQELDFELEMGCLVGPGNALGQPIPVAQAADHIFGLLLVNDWSARDIQRWEYRPLGPFLSKSFATSISPWVVTMEALEPFRCPGPAQAPPPLPYLQGQGDWAYDIMLEVRLQSPRMAEPVVISRGNYRTLYWNMAQQVAHHSSGGCNLRPGDLLASGTISGPTPGSRGSLLELSWGGEQPLALPNGEIRRFLEDGDRLTMSGWCQGDGYRIGFGELTGEILPAH